eukprot:snap_masked-scaffold_21-processed-gene-0.27-mRNA-1 protein AED:1.00 eAED:1.00 QI:0/0/0/0/1/1/2/0/59
MDKVLYNKQYAVDGWGGETYGSNEVILFSFGMISENFSGVSCLKNRDDVIWFDKTCGIL